MWMSKCYKLYGVVNKGEVVRLCRRIKINDYLIHCPRRQQNTDGQIFPWQPSRDDQRTDYKKDRQVFLWQPSQDNITEKYKKKC